MIEFITANLGMIENICIVLGLLALFSSFCRNTRESMDFFFDESNSQILNYIWIVLLIPFVIVVPISMGIEVVLLHMLLPTMTLKQLFVISLIIDYNTNPVSYALMPVITRLERLLKANGIENKFNKKMK